QQTGRRPGTADHFAALPGPPWKLFTRGAGKLEPAGHSLRFVTAGAVAGRYSNAQLDDYRGLPRRKFLWRPPLKMTVRASFSHPAGELRGTAGFGFWNDPFLMTGLRRPTLPRAVWFFYASPPSNMKLHLTTPGSGWKAATIDALRPSFLALAALAPLAVPLMRFGPLYRALWPAAQRAINVSEAPVAAAMTARHTYTLHWLPGGVRFGVDGETILNCRTVPRGPLGFVMWLDNQYMVVTPWGRLKHGLLNAPGTQWLEVDRLEIEPIATSPNLRYKPTRLRRKPAMTITLRCIACQKNTPPPRFATCATAAACSTCGTIWKPCAPTSRAACSTGG
ncbi:MAG: hypothetical protein ACE5G8_13085, partial [Anaerolineae bacterium]